ncbi:MAG: ThiF family adenylyltransferase [Anaerolineae bacterium]
MSESLQMRLNELAELEGELKVIPLDRLQALAHEFDLSLREVELAALEARILPRRYLRSFGTVGWEGQIKLLNSTVTVVGLGGLGGNVVEGLARMGVGRLILIDGDVFVDHNLNRQILSTEAILGSSKTEVARARVAQINSALEVVLHSVQATAETLPRLLKGADVVVDALDRLPTRLALQKAAQTLGIPMVHGAIAGYVGQVMTIFPGDGGLQAFYGEDVPQQGAEVQLGCPAATPMMVSAWQVQETLKILLGCGQLLRHKMLFMDAEMGRVEILKVGP